MSITERVYLLPSLMRTSAKGALEERIVHLLYVTDKGYGLSLLSTPYAALASLSRELPSI